MSDLVVSLAPVAPVPVVTLTAVEQAPSLTLLDQAGNALDPASSPIQLALQAFMKGDPGTPAPFPDVAFVVDFAPAGTEASFVQSGTLAAPILTLTLPAATQTTLTFPFATASTSWAVQHNTGRYPSVTVVDTAGDVIFADIDYVDANNLVVNFANPTAGTAYLN